MHVIFLDIDGVLNSEAYAIKLDEKHRQLGHTEPASPKRETTCDCFKLYHQIDRDAIERLNRLVAETDAKIVVSSTWRKLFDLPDLRQMLEGHGLVGEIIGATPEGHDEPEMLTVYGPLERMHRGYEIDFWLRAHPEVDRFVILDDGSDMAMHRRRLVQTDCEDGLLDVHVDLAIRVMAWDGEALHPFEEKEAEEAAAVHQIREKARAGGHAIHFRPYPAMAAETPCGQTIAKLKPHEFSIQRQLVTCEECLAHTEEDGKTTPFLISEAFDAEPSATIVSTRSSASEDARRDFDDFDVDEELRRLRVALGDGQWRIAAELMANLDEHLCRGGSLPVAWLGPTCMQDQADLAARHQSSVEAAAQMTQEARQEAIDGYVAVAPPPIKPPGSSAGLYCNHDQLLRSGGCPERLELARTTAVRPTHEDDYEQLMPALDEAAVALGWRIYKCVWWCPSHVVAKNLVCARCLSACPACFCIDGPHGDAVDGIVVEVTETPRP